MRHIAARVEAMVLAGLLVAAFGCSSATTPSNSSTPPTNNVPEQGGVVVPPTPGCVDGLLSDPRTFFFWKIGREIGAPADDWMRVMEQSGWPGGSGARPAVGPPFYGIIQQVNSSGSPRGRLFLPTDAAPNSTAFFSREIDFLGVGGSGLVWDWREQTNAPAYAPQACS
jgi:hypothetical protein